MIIFAPAIARVFAAAAERREVERQAARRREVERKEDRRRRHERGAQLRREAAKRAAKRRRGVTGSTAGTQEREGTDEAKIEVPAS